MSDKIIDPIQLTQDLIRCPSVTPKNEGALEICAKALEAMGFDIFWLPFEGRGGSYAVQNIFARKGTKSPHVCFMGHTDVVPEGDASQWTFPPFSATIHNGLLYGRGAADMKTGVATSIAAVSQFLWDHPHFDGSISFLITGDEEKESVNGTEPVVEWMKDNHHIPDMALVAEPSNQGRMGEAMRIGRRGSYKGIITTTGKQGHSAYPDRFINPINKMTRLMAALTDEHSAEGTLFLDQGNAHFPPTHLAITSVDVGNTANNVVPEKCILRFNVRYNSDWTQEKLDHHIKDRLQKTGVDFSYHSKDGSFSFLTQPGDWTEIVRSSVEKITGSSPRLDTGGGTSDARFIAHLCPVVEYGVLVDTNHQTDEHIALEHILSATKTYVEILNKVFVRS
jgi:succinyl-diaminopimelate desuccinylase